MVALIKTKRPGTTVTVNLDGQGFDLEFEVVAHYSPGTPDVFYLPNGDPGYPGDPAELDITRISLWGVDVTRSIPDEVYELIYDKALEDEVWTEPPDEPEYYEDNQWD